MKKIKAIVIGYGDRGSIYASYALECPNELEIVGVCDPNKDRLKLAKELHHLSDEVLFTDLDECLKKNIPCDLYINGTMDQIHYDVLKKLLMMKSAILTEKPIVNNEKQLLELEKLANDNNVPVYVGHVLRYTPFYKTIKQLILNDEIGEIRTMEMAEHVGSAHFAGSYIRGKWNNEEECGSTLLLAKSCHDVDIMCWLNNKTTPEYVSSFGGRYYFKKENAPHGATKKCFDCPHEKTCYFSAYNCYVKADFSNELTRFEKGKQSEEKVNEMVRDSEFGDCVYMIEKSNVVDRQVVNVEFENGSVCSFMLTGGVQEPCRTISVIGTKGEISGKLEEGIIYLKKDNNCSTVPNVTKIDVNTQLHNGNRLTGHSGGDYEIMKSLVRYMNGNSNIITITKLSDSINGHLCVYAADESRLNHKIVKLSR